MLDMPASQTIRAGQEISVRHALRTATADLHSRVDAAFSGPFDRDTEAYADFLQSMARSVLPLERALDAAEVEKVLPDWPARCRSAALKTDLAVFGRLLPAEAPVGRVGGEAWQLGALYVLEGSRLGAKLLLRRVLANPDPVAHRATTYLRHGEEEKLWPSFLARLEASPAVAAAPAEAVAGARAAFAAFGA
ncbi:MAG: biliverdin-producing heme oxygenase [Proteobacteria bacterium]|nr:biliverdin-producing heme oxygenase [Pseudomonadota bacterium]